MNNESEVKMLKLNDVINENQKVILRVFKDKKTIKRAEKRIAKFNAKTQNFLKNVDELAEKIKINF